MIDENYFLARQGITLYLNINLIHEGQLLCITRFFFLNIWICIGNIDQIS